LTGKYLKGEEFIEIPKKRRMGGYPIKILGGEENN
jgi:excinuclease UvrABC ATPase subunit